MNLNHLFNLQKSGDLINAEKGYRKLIKQKKISSEIFCNLGIICFKTKRDDEAIKLFSKALMINPKNVVALNNIGLIYIHKKKFVVAKKYFQKALILKKNPKTYFFLGLIYTEINEYSKAITSYKNSIKLDNNAESLCNLGDLFYINGNLESAEKFTTLSLKNNPQMDSALNNLGLISLAKGEIKQAKKLFLKTLKINPENFKAHYNLSKITNFKKNKSYKNELLENLKKAKSNSDKSSLSFAIGKAYQDIKDYKIAIKYFIEANKIKRKNINYSIKNDKILFDNIKKTFNYELMSKFKTSGYEDQSSIFILGMPRSGTSLIEQVLASHSNVYGAGEINVLDDIMKKYFFNKKNKLEFNKFNKTNIYNAGKAYTEKTKKFIKNKIYITNKLPANFRWIGLINLILPKAKIVHCKRNHLDTCLSIFQQNFFVKGNEYSFDLSEIGQYYNLYLDIMQYWKNNVINNFYEIEYENFIKKQKIETKNILNFLNLKWENNCMKFYETKRVVRTSSEYQVRKKIYKSSVNKWELYRNDLKFLKQIINLK